MSLPPLPEFSVPAPRTPIGESADTGVVANFIAYHALKQAHFFRSRDESLRQEELAVKTRLAEAQEAAVAALNRPEPVAPKTDNELLFSLMVAFADPGVDSSNVLSKAETAFAAYKARVQPPGVNPTPMLPPGE